MTQRMHPSLGASAGAPARGTVRCTDSPGAEYGGSFLVTRVPRIPPWACLVRVRLPGYCYFVRRKLLADSVVPLTVRGRRARMLGNSSAAGYFRGGVRRTVPLRASKNSSPVKCHWHERL